MENVNASNMTEAMLFASIRRYFVYDVEFEDAGQYELVMVAAGGVDLTTDTDLLDLPNWYIPRTEFECRRSPWAVQCLRAGSAHAVRHAP